MKVSIFTLKKTLFKDEAQMLNVKTLDGELTILPNHIPLITELRPGNIRIIDKNHKESIIAISSGFLEVNPREIKILCEQYAESN